MRKIYNLSTLELLSNFAYINNSLKHNARAEFFIFLALFKTAKLEYVIRDNSMKADKIEKLL